MELHLELGNAAMSTPADVADALRDAADHVEGGRLESSIRDRNGNTVGRWTVSFPPAEPGE